MDKLQAFTVATAPEYDAFEFQAELNITKHLGGVDATQTLIEYCQIDADSHVLDAGCGVGITPVALAQQVGCTVVGVDLRRSMIARARERAQQARLSHRVQFQVADIQHLPFDDNTFDVVLSESVLAFPADKAQALGEYVRVTKPGGYLGLNEAIWVKTPPPEMLDFVAQAGSQTRLLVHEDMKALLVANGLEVVLAQPFEITARDEALTQIRRIGWGSIVKSWGRALSMYFRRPDYRTFLQDAARTPKDLAGYMGYGLYVARK